ncbi:NAD(P)-binding domain-containing protein [Streptomyces sp. NPDC003077]|uniref:imine reductase family protein n=1 Tax=Streptomyces sp. NPDC003077 TaxID=3154443 RepID=UPI0033A6A5C9
MSANAPKTHAEPVTIAGPGMTGSALVSASLDQGYTTTVWNRSSAKAAPLVEKGAVAAATVAEAVAASPVSILCLPGDFPAYSAQWFGQVVEPGLPEMARQVDERSYATGISTLHVNRHALAHLVATGKAQGIAPDLALPFQARIERRIAQGHGADNLASLVEVLRNPSA